MATIKMSDLMDSDIGRAFNARELAQKEQEGIKPMAGRRGKRPLAVSKTLIFNFIAGAKDPVTFLEICDYLERKPAPHFRAILDDLVASGQVNKGVDYEAGPNLPRYLYSLNR
jgi:hypothetical protein